MLFDQMFHCGTTAAKHCLFCVEAAIIGSHVFAVSSKEAVLLDYTTGWTHPVFDIGLLTLFFKQVMIFVGSIVKILSILTFTTHPQLCRQQDLVANYFVVRHCGEESQCLKLRIPVLKFVGL